MLISELDPENKKKALEYKIVQSDILISAFDFSKTKEGVKYWRDLHNAIFIDNDKPAHYDNGTSKDVIDFCQDYNLNFCRGSSVKYIARAGKKDNEIQDLKKAIDFLQREIKNLEK